MSLPKPNLDDKTFLDLAEEARALIPSLAKDWTDHNIHDPGITFLDLFAWLVEIQHYRLNRVSDESFRRFFGLVGLTPQSRRPAEVIVTFDYKSQPVFVPAGTRVAPTSVSDLPFETIEDCFLTPARLVEVFTQVQGRELQQTIAQDKSAGHYEAFGANPAVGDSLILGFDRWFTAPDIRLSITLFEDDLPPRVPLAEEAPGFVPSASLRWEHRAQDEWKTCEVLADTTLHFSRSGNLIFRAATDATPSDGLYWIRATLAAGTYEIPPRIAAIRTNSIRTRQVETIVNEDLKLGLGTPDQAVRLKKYPVMVGTDFAGDPFQAGEILDWRELLIRLARPAKLVPPPLEKAVDAIAKELTKLDAGVMALLEAASTTEPRTPEFQALRPEAHWVLGKSFKKLLEAETLYDRKLFDGFSVPPQFADLAGGRAHGEVKASRVRQFNRLLLQWLFPDLLLSDRVEVQTGQPASKVETEPMTWVSWTRVDDFANSRREDRHYVLEPETGVIRFGNGFNGRVPSTTEHIRARFYRHTRADKGNVPAGMSWSLSVPTAPGQPGSLPLAGVSGTNFSPGQGGVRAESIEEAKFRSRQVFRTPQRVLTAADYETETLRTPGLRVARAKALANHNPALSPRIVCPGEVAMVVVPTPPHGEIQPGVAPSSPSPGFRDTIRNYLNTLRMVTAKVHVIGPEWVEVKVSAHVFLRKGVAVDEVRERLNRCLNQFLNPLEGGPEPGQGWPFGRAAYPSEIHQLLASLTEVEYVTGVALNQNAAEQALELSPNSLPFPGGHSLDLIPYEGWSGAESRPKPERETGGCGHA